MIRLNCIQARIGNAVAPATISLRKYQSKRMSNTGNIIYSSSEKGFGDAATERRSAGAKKVRTVLLICNKIYWTSMVYNSSMGNQEA